MGLFHTAVYSQQQLSPHRTMPFSRVDIEKPNRTLFIRNVNYKSTEDEVRKVFEQYGIVTNIFSRIEKRGMVFVTFSDIRDAEKAKAALQNTDIGGRAIDVHFSLPRAEDDSYAEQAQRNSQDTLFVSLREGQEDLTEEEAREFFSQYGDVKDVRSSPGHTKQRFVEFYDVQACDQAIQESNGAKYKDGVLFVRAAHNRYEPGRRRRESPHSERSGPGPRRDRDHNRDWDRDRSWDNRPYERPASSSSSHDRYRDRDPQMNQRPSQSGVNHIIRDLASALKQQAHERSSSSSISHSAPSYASPLPAPSSSYYDSQPPPSYYPPPSQNYSHSYIPPPDNGRMPPTSNHGYSVPNDVPIASLPYTPYQHQHPPPRQHHEPPPVPNHSGQVSDILRQLQQITSQSRTHNSQPPPDSRGSYGESWDHQSSSSSQSYPQYPPPTQAAPSTYPSVNSNNRFLSQPSRPSSQHYSAPYMP